MDTISTAGSQEFEDLAIEKLYKTISPYLGPSPIAIWFVDCIGEYYRFLNYVTNSPQHYGGLELAGTPYDRPYPYSIYGLPIYPWQSSIATEHEKNHAPEFCKELGIWVEMSDGSHFKLSWERPLLDEHSRLDA